MKLVNLSQDDFKKYANSHKERNIEQTIEYSKLPLNGDYEKEFLGLKDDNNTLKAACLVLIKDISKQYKSAYIPSGFLIDYDDYDLVYQFTKYLEDYLKKERIIYFTINPMFKLRVYNKNLKIINDNSQILEYLNNQGYEDMQFGNEFEQYDIIIENDNSESIYKNFNRNTKRSIKEAIQLGITIHKAKVNELDDFYNLIEKKTDKSKTFYYNLKNTFNTKDNKMEIFFTKLNPQVFLSSTKKLYEDAILKNERIHAYISKKNGKMTETILNKKLDSDKQVEKMHELLNKALLLVNQTDNDIIIATSAIIRNNKEISFIVDGFNDKYRYIHSSALLKWAIIKKYADIGYKRFNLGEIHQYHFNKNNKYNGMFMFKLGFGGNIVEYSPSLIYITDKRSYQRFINIKNIKQKLKINKKES